VIGQSLILARNGQFSGIDIDTLIHRLLLFDGYVLRTSRFIEIRFLVEMIGYDQTLELLRSGLLEIRCEVHQIASQRDAELRQHARPTFSLVWIEAHDWEQYVTKCLNELKAQLELTVAQWDCLESAIRSCLRRLDWETKQEIAASFINSMERAPDVLEESVRLAGRRRRLPIVLPNFEIRAARLDDDLICVESNLSHIRIPREELWEIIRDGLMGVGVLEQNIGEMKRYQAMGGFSAEELQVFQRRLSGIAGAVDPTDAEKRLFRVARLVGMPLFDASTMNLRIDALLGIRESDELRAFRDWLATSDGLDDKHVRALLKGYRARLATRFRSGSATVTRLMVECAVGVKNPVAGLALTVLDSFLLEKLLPHSGPAAFINKTFPSLFAKRNASS